MKNERRGKGISFCPYLLKCLVIMHATRLCFTITFLLVYFRVYLNCWRIMHARLFLWMGPAWLWLDSLRQPPYLFFSWKDILINADASCSCLIYCLNEILIANFFNYFLLSDNGKII